MNIVSNIIDYFTSCKDRREQRRLELLNEYQQLIINCEGAIAKYISLINRNIYIDYQLKDKWKADFKIPYEATHKIDKYNKIKTSEEGKQKILEFRKL